MQWEYKCVNLFSFKKEKTYIIITVGLKTDRDGQKLTVMTTTTVGFILKTYSDRYILKRISKKLCPPLGLSVGLKV